MHDLHFVVLSFEGPDLYSSAGGIGSRVTELCSTLAGGGFETHLFFIGDPDLPGEENSGCEHLHLHRWCQWISRYHPGGVYDGEEGKLRDWHDSLHPWLTSEVLAPAIANGDSVVVIAEEWQTAETVIRLRRAIEEQGWSDKIRIFWNANNTFSFDRINWAELNRAATITTVSRYMKHEMWRHGVDARIIPNGIAEEWLRPSDGSTVAGLRSLFKDRLSVVKVGRFDPNKRWVMAVDAVAHLKQIGVKPLLLARGGSEAHGWEVLQRADTHGLSVARCSPDGGDRGLQKAIEVSLSADIVLLEKHLDLGQRKALFGAADAVLANSGIEPYGLVGLESMASGGFTLTGSTGEDYACSGFDSIALQTAEPRELVHHLMLCSESPETVTRIREAATISAARYTWQNVLERSFLPLLRELGLKVQSRALMPARLDSVSG